MHRVTNTLSLFVQIAIKRHSLCRRRKQPQSMNPRRSLVQFIAVICTQTKVSVLIVQYAATHTLSHKYFQCPSPNESCHPESESHSIYKPAAPDITYNISSTHSLPLSPFVSLRSAAFKRSRCGMTGSRPPGTATCSTSWCIYCREHCWCGCGIMLDGISIW